MKWRELLYFSKGERRALSVLFCLISISFILLRVSNPTQAEAEVPYAPTAVSNPIQPDKPVTKPDVQLSSSVPFSRSTERKVASKMKSERLSPQTAKYPAGTVLELNSADTAELKKIPGIGTAFANRIVKYRNLLGGYSTVRQLSEVYGIDEDKYASLSPWCKVDASLITTIKVNTVLPDSLIRHPYLNYKQAKVIRQLRKQKGRLSGWDNLLLLEEFGEQDVLRLTPYLSFE